MIFKTDIKKESKKGNKKVIKPHHILKFKEEISINNNIKEKKIIVNIPQKFLKKIKIRKEFCQIILILLLMKV